MNEPEQCFLIFLAADPIFWPQNICGFLIKNKAKKLLMLDTKSICWSVDPQSQSDGIVTWASKPKLILPLCKASCNRLMSWLMEQFFAWSSEKVISWVYSTSSSEPLQSILIHFVAYISTPPLKSARRVKSYQFQETRLTK